MTPSTILAWFETRLRPTALPTGGPPPAGLIAFYWHFARQAKGLFAALFAAGLSVAALDTLVPVFIGRLVALASSPPESAAWTRAWPELALMAAIMLVARPLAILLQNLLTNQAIAANLTSLTRWQAHWHLVRQSWSFFQSDFAGRLANRVIQTGGALRESLVQLVQSVWYIVVYGTLALVWLAAIDWRLALPLGVWALCYATLLRLYVPRMRDRSRAQSEMRSWLIGRVVDTYANIQTVKLFARPRDEDDYIRGAIESHTGAVQRMLRLQTGFALCLSTLNACLLVATAAIGIALWREGVIAGAALATALPLAWQIVNIAGWVAYQVTSLFENVGVVQEGMLTIAQPIDMPDAPGAAELVVRDGALAFEKVGFAYGRSTGVIHDLDLAVAAGERIGLVGASGAGKSTLVNLLLGFLPAGIGAHPGRRPGRHARDPGEPARAHRRRDPGHRAAAPLDRENIRYGRPEASDDEVSRRRSAPRRTTSSWRSRTGRAGAATTRMSASAA
jgi:ATP-binding cassette, subfamily B, multidrug efflux pump